MMCASTSSSSSFGRLVVRARPVSVALDVGLFELLLLLL